LQDCYPHPHAHRSLRDAAKRNVRNLRYITLSLQEFQITRAVGSHSKLQNPNFKLQTSNFKLQNPKSKLQTTFFFSTFIGG